MGAAGNPPQSLSGKTHAARAGLDITCGSAFFCCAGRTAACDGHTVDEHVLVRDSLCLDAVGPVPRTLLGTWCWVASHCQAATSAKYTSPPFVLCVYLFLKSSIL